jgi:hypothetical protein
MTSVIVSLVPLTVVVLIAWVTTWAILRSRRDRSSAGHNHQPVGVGGWLLFLILVLMWIGPLAGAGRINADIVAAESRFPSLVATVTWRAFTHATWWAFFGLSCVSFYAGVVLARRRDRSAITRARIALWILGPGAVLVMQVMIPFFTLGDLEPAAQILVRLAVSIIVVELWTLYLLKSRRVQATYSRLTVGA